MQAALISGHSRWAAVLLLALHYAAGGHAQQPPQQHDANVARNSAVRWNRQQHAASPATQACEYKELMMKMYDRIGVLATLDEDLRNRLENVDKKMNQFEVSNLSRLDSIAGQQTDILTQLNRLERAQLMSNHLLAELKDLSMSRVTRQTTTSLPSDTSATGLGNSQKLDALATLLASTAATVNALQVQVQSNFSQLFQTTSIFQRRLNNIQRRQQNTHGGQGYTPTSPPNFYATASLPQQLSTNCAQGAPTTNGILKLQLTTTSDPFYVLCDEQSFSGGWTVVLNRFNGDVNFQRDWLEYKAGFGNLAGEFFIGLEKLHALTASAVHELLVVLEDFDGVQRFANYNLFAIGGEPESYALNLLGSYEGNAGDAMTYHAGSKFSTFDNDNDGCVECNCAQAHMGAWWYNWCEMSNLNGKYFATDYEKAPTYQGMYWHHFHGPNYSLKAVRMMIRPVGLEHETRR